VGTIPHESKSKIKQRYRSENKAFGNHEVVRNFKLVIIMKTFHTDVYYLQQYQIPTNRRRYYQATNANTTVEFRCDFEAINDNSDAIDTHGDAKNPRDY